MSEGIKPSCTHKNLIPSFSAFYFYFLFPIFFFLLPFLSNADIINIEIIANADIPNTTNQAATRVSSPVFGESVPGADGFAVSFVLPEAPCVSSDSLSDV